MDIKELLTKEPEEILKALAVKQERKVPLDECKKQYDPKKHDVFDSAKRPMKKVKKATDTRDENNEVVYNEVIGAPE